MADTDEFTTRRVILVEMTLPKGSWSSSELGDALTEAVPLLEPTVYGELDVGSFDATRAKINQLTREIEKLGRIEGDPGILHSVYKAMSFFRDIFPDKFYKTRTQAKKAA